MIPLTQYITESFDRYMEMSPKDKHALLKLDKKFHKYMEEFCHEQVHFMNVANLQEEMERIVKKVEKNEDFEVKIKPEKNKFEDEYFCHRLAEAFQELRHEFTTLNCFLSKYYIELCEEKIRQIDFFNTYYKKKNLKPKYNTKPSKRVYDEAVKILKKHKFQKVDKMDKKFQRNVSPEKSQERLQKAIDDRGLDWKVVIDDNMVPRMSVRPYREFRISRTNLFSEVDLQSLEVHEVEVHTARKHCGLQTGLYLFLYGLGGSNIFDEGIAIYNSLNKCKNQKPNILFYVAIKIVIAYHLYEMDALELFKFVKDLTGAPDKVIAKQMVRVNRCMDNTTLFFSSANFGSADQDYLNGYMMVRDMSEAERQELIKYPIGPAQMYELDNIKKFLKVNKFEPLEYKEGSKIKV